MTLVDIHLLNAMRAERDAALAENARLRAAVEDVLITHPAGTHDAAWMHLKVRAALAAPPADDGAERGAR